MIYGHEFNEWKKRKSYLPEQGVWVRKRDCEIALLDGYDWYDCNLKQDFAGNTFTKFMARGKMDKGYILEPDTTVPNYTTNVADAFWLSCNIDIPEMIAINQRYMEDFNRIILV